MDSWPDLRRYFTSGAPLVLAVSAARSDIIRHPKGPPSKADVGGRSHGLPYFTAAPSALVHDPFNADEQVEFPITFGDFVRLYETRPR
jgi:hypothetical protein